MKKLIPALCMLLVATALLGTSTFAWFSMNTTVEAAGMQVQAKASSNLLIANSSGTVWNRSAMASNGTASLYPASTSTTSGVLSAAKFFKVANSETVNYSDGKAQSTTTFAEVTPTPDRANDYVYANTFKIKVEGNDTFSNLYISGITVKDGGNDPDSAISSALRVAVVTADKAYLFTPVASTSTYKGIIAAGTGTADTVATAAETITAVGEAATLGSVGTTEVTVVVYVWYEGQDAACTSANAISVETLSVSVSFAAKNA